MVKTKKVNRAINKRAQKTQHKVAAANPSRASEFAEKKATPIVCLVKTDAKTNIPRKHQSNGKLRSLRHSRNGKINPKINDVFHCVAAEISKCPPWADFIH